ncbi:MAG: PDZ domain-containing protein [Flavobacteriales bacterium]|jgi:C-terminal processing protease CtpA/Prc
MKKTLCAFVCLGLLIAGGTWAQQKAQIRIKKNVNGVESEETREFMLDDNSQLEEVLKEINEQNSKEPGLIDQQIEINIQSTGEFPSGNFGGSMFSMPFGASPFTDPDKPKLGVMLREEQSADVKGKNTGGITISEVMPNMPGERAGLQKGDVIISIDDEPITAAAQVLAKVKSIGQNGGELRFVVKRNKRKKKITVEFPAVPWHRRQVEIPGVRDDFNMNDSLLLTQPFNREGFNTGETAYLGVTPANDPTTVGIAVNVEEKSPAAEMGLLDGDVILECNGEAIGDFNALANAVRKCKPGSSVELLISRDGKEKRITGALGKRSISASEDFQIFHDYKGMDDQGNYFYDFEFNMDAEDLQKRMEEFLRDFNVNAPLADEFYPGENRSGNFIISIDDLNAAEKASRDIPTESIGFDQLSIVPKPALSAVDLQFTLTESAPFSVVIQDEAKQTLVYDERGNNATDYSRLIDLRDYPAGSYYLIIAQGNNAYCKKLVKQSR